MPRNGSGNFSFPATTWDPAVTGVTATVNDWNTREADLASAISGSVAADGQTPMTGNLPMGGNRVTGAAAAAATTDLATFGQVGWVLLSSASASASATIPFTALGGGSYSAFKLVINGLVPATNATNLLVRISTGSGFLATAYRHATFRWTTSTNGQSGSTSDSQWIPNGSTETCGTGANQLTSYEITIFDAPATYPTKRAVWSAAGLWSSGSYVVMHGGGEVDTQSAVIDGIQCLMDSGNISSGRFYLYGLRNA